ncbi:MAG TPA: ABC-2 family transporter protein [Opitutaceae bacterium]|nr:ABC-2 family transporter protein [Opitutaceae bacterium]
MFRFDFFLWAMVELLWMSVNLLLVTVIYEHTDSVAGWTKYEMILLVGTAMLIQRYVMGFFWSNLFEMARNVRTGTFDFFLAQPGNPLFMVATRKLDPDGLCNSFVAMGVVIYAAHKLGLHPGFADLALYALMILCGLAIHFSVLVISASLVFWTTGGDSVVASYFSLFEFSRLPRAAFKGLAETVFVWILPVVVVSNAPASTLLHGFHPSYAVWLAGVTAAWLAVAILFFNLGLRRYASASS